MPPSVSDPSERVVRRLPDPAQAQARFGATSAQIQAVEVVAERCRADGHGCDQRRRRLRVGHRHGRAGEPGVRRLVRQLHRPVRPDGARACARRHHPELRGQRRAGSVRARHRLARDEARRHTAAPGAELLGGPADVDLLRVRRSPTANRLPTGSTGRGPSGATPRSRSVAPTTCPTRA